MPRSTLLDERMSPTNHNPSFATPGESYLILASAATLKKHLTESYWIPQMELVCDGQLEGVMVRYTGQSIAFLQFRPTTVSSAGYRYPISMSFPVEFLVPTSAAAAAMGMSPFTPDLPCSPAGAPSSDLSSDEDMAESIPRLCIVCGRYNMPKMLHRSHGWKCRPCKGKKSSRKLRTEAAKLIETIKTLTE